MNTRERESYLAYEVRRASEIKIQPREVIGTLAVIAAVVSIYYLLWLVGVWVFTVISKAFA